jgi:hypothetical protein
MNQGAGRRVLMKKTACKKSHATVPLIVVFAEKKQCEFTRYCAGDDAYLPNLWNEIVRIHSPSNFEHHCEFGTKIANILEVESGFQVG